jgi:hypothetical protein
MTPAGWILANMVRDGLRRAHRAAAIVGKRYPRGDIEIMLVDRAGYLGGEGWHIDMADEIEVRFLYDLDQDGNYQELMLPINSTLGKMVGFLGGIAAKAGREAGAGSEVPP